MKNLIINKNPEVDSKFQEYPKEIESKLNYLRSLIIETATENDGIVEIEETLKWGEPSYLTKHGSTLRMDWKEKSPEQYAIYFKCTSKLVPTFKTLYKGKFKFENNRAIIFRLDDSIPETELKHCISMALTYHKIKHLPLLGA